MIKSIYLVIRMKSLLYLLIVIITIIEIKCKHSLHFLSSILPNNNNNNNYNNNINNINDSQGFIKPFFNLNLNFGNYDRSHDSLLRITNNELKQVLSKCLNMINMSKTSIILSGWKLVHHNYNENFTLYKKKIKEKGYRVVYLMIGEFKDISGRTFLNYQFNPVLRKQWDITCREMITEGNDKIKLLLKGDKDSADLLYYRTKWPFPLKDRDYVLARRTRYYPDKKAIVLISKSTDSKVFPRKTGHVMRIDKYWCHTTVVGKDHIDKSGCKFLTFFCDDVQIPLPMKVVDLLCKAGERLVPDSMSSLHRVAKSVA